MRIADKIFIIVLLLIAALSVNTFVALRQVARLGQQLREVADKDMVLISVGNSVMRNYLENAVRFQSLLMIGDELAFAQMPSSRRQYLIKHIDKVKEGFDRLTQVTGESILKGKDLIQRDLDKSTNPVWRQGLNQTKEFLERIETAYVEYDQLFKDIYQLISSGKYELSLDDLGIVHQKEKMLAEKITSLIGQIQQSTQATLRRASLEEELARSSLWGGFVGISMISLMMSVFLIRGFSLPLKALVAAAQQIGSGNFKVNLKVKYQDEVGEVSHAFMTMTRQLDQFKTELEKQKDALVKNLQLMESQKQDLEKVNTELDRFVYTVSHDIAAPLTGIEGYGDYLEKHYFEQFDKKGQRSLIGLRRGTKRLNDMIQDLLALTRISRIKNPYTRVDVQVLLDTVLERLEYVIRESHARIVFVTKMPTIVCDRVKLTEVFDNLIHNAVKFSTAEQGPQVEIGCIEQAECFEFYVRDQGLGIAPEHHEEIFNIFKRLDSSAIIEGTGAGLSIVKAGVEDQGGRVWVESQLGQGATFRFTISKSLEVSDKHVTS
ncbi:MAG: HAMP domain-containing protein [Candidatus Omnitrophica bacterium]|nr:HAMP domain-containing protein [Candidatus Omnitrophota bacterium]